ncbi:hypothetical protein [Qipengyuania psychrotolerans]|uniref:Glycine zipper domain-containing protein n=1 Tax=Qipengyuania psychrotolerans TaxID=2867238 RepID=A0ABX8ZEX7_9SPHN|nr:hypothetical protein [Qipengyuania psychrotolerans]QZD87551.1 hypothetical protein K3166_02240 [Qipengyuania psychrotolerans]
MIGKIIGAYMGDRLAKKTSTGIGGAGGAALGVIAATALRRVSLPAMLAIGAGGYLAKKLTEKNTKTASETTVDAKPVQKKSAKAA